jgi:transposase-like protein
VFLEAVKGSFLSHKRCIEHGITFLSENHGFRMEIIAMGSTINYCNGEYHKFASLNVFKLLNQWCETVWTCGNAVERIDVDISLSEKL